MRKNVDYHKLAELFAVFFKISAVTIGGGMTMIPVMEREFLEKRNWITSEDMVDTVAVVQSMPGIIAVNMAIMLGYRIAGLPGAFLSAFAVVIPPFLAILAIAYFFTSLSGNETLSNIFSGVRAAVCGLILVSAIKIGKKLLRSPFPWITAGVSFGIFIFLPQINAIWVIVAAGAAGLLLPYLLPVRRNAGEKQK